MYVFVGVQEPESYYRDGPSGLVKARLEKASGERCLIVPYREFDLGVVESLQPRAVVMSGFGGHVQSREIDWFLGIDEALHNTDLPILCFCGTHQILGFSFNRNLKEAGELRDEPMRGIGPTEDLPRRAQRDPKCSHYCEVKQLPAGFDLLASSQHCKIEAMRHCERPLYGTQFHPEAYEAPFFDGRRLLENFVAIVEGFWKHKVTDCSRVCPQPWRGET